MGCVCGGVLLSYGSPLTTDLLRPLGPPAGCLSGEPADEAFKDVN